jgi:hypothetical protein
VSIFFVIGLAGWVGGGMERHNKSLIERAEAAYFLNVADGGSIIDTGNNDK